MVSRTVTVNAAFLREIKEDNEQLRRLLAESYTSFATCSPILKEPQRLSTLIDALRDQLAMHFALEEAYGYFEDPVAVAPHLADQAESLRRQHGELYAEICRLADRIRNDSCRSGSSHGAEQVARQFREFYSRLKQHEAKENDLIVQAYNVDIGVGD